MTETKGNLWVYAVKGHPIVVPTNNDVNSRGQCVMGRGVARQAAVRYPGLAEAIGTCVAHGGGRVRWFKRWNLFTFPVKHHWSEKADLRLIDWSAQDLAALVDVIVPLRFPVYLPRVGCGNGKLLWSTVKLVLGAHLNDSFTVVELDAESL